ncbi:HNH endonuclease [Jannaschia seohaensis]|uniref:HNH endonuclease n=1 Tax=Jannaschia seohaensis TaxID=475081 RepID=A0A2Y9A153_9RHOB|nr:HNH endonuclease [Jannaschia seohaensis]SSA38180.1 HNH endonuclease [Jannaschia seohaensis]
MPNIKAIRDRKMRVQKGRCYYCGLPMWSERMRISGKAAQGRYPIRLRCTAEHLRPRSAGGADSADNIVAAHFFCNRARHQGKTARCPEGHRAHVMGRMAHGRWMDARMREIARSFR